MTKPNTRSNTTTKNGADNQFDSQLNLIDDENPTIKDVYKVLKGMSKSLSFLAEGYEEFKNKIITLETENKNLKATSEQLNKRLQYLETDYYNEQQQKLQNYITIHGIPQIKNEEVINTVIKIAEKLNVKIEQDDIISHRMMNMKNHSNFSPIMVVELKDIEVKQKIKCNFKNNGPIIVSQILKSAINTNKEHQKIYINDYLCNYVKQLLEQTKKIQAKCNLKFVWTKNGYVYARYNEGTPIIKIRNFSTITELEEEAKNS